MTPMELKLELERLEKGTTPAPWESDSGGTYREAEAQAVMLGGPDDKPQRLFDTLNSDVAVIEHDGDEDGTYYWDSQGQKNFALIESLVNNLPTILRALSALSGLEGVKGALKDLIEQAAHDQKLNQDDEAGGWWSVKTAEAIVAARSALSQLDQLEAAGK